MKKLFFLFVMILSMNWVFSQQINESQVPALVKSKFQSLHPTIKDVKWIKSTKGDYVADFAQNKVRYGVTLDSLGNLKTTGNEMNVTELSKEINDYVTKNFPGYSITEAAQIIYADGKPMYEAAVTKGKDKFNLLFDSSFRFVKKERY